jgi:ribosome biogenesis GTPase A
MDMKDLSWFPGHMAKTLRSIAERLPQVDLVIETCDARIPDSSRNPELDRIIGMKPRLVVLNKADLADEKKTTEWIGSLKKENCAAIPCDSLHRKGLDRVKDAAVDLCSARLERAAERGRIFRPVRVMVVGIPNTGKSTLINALSGKKAAKVEDRPGITRGAQWIRGEGILELMDMHGVLWPQLGSDHRRLRLAATGAIRDEVMETHELATATMALLAALYPALLSKRYSLVDLSLSADELMEAAARRRGCLLSGGRVDLVRFSTLFLDEVRGGVLGRMTLESPGDILPDPA